MKVNLIKLLIVIVVLFTACAPEPEAYDAILADYKALVDYRFSEDFESEYNGGIDIALSDQLSADISGDLGYHWSNMFVEMPGYPRAEKGDFGYKLIDINEDTVPELFWVRSDDFILAVFTIYNGEPQLLDAYWSRYDAVLTDDLQLYTSGSGGAEYTTYQLHEISPSGEKLVSVMEFGTDGHSEPDMQLKYYEFVDEVKTQISKEHLDQLISDHPFAFGEVWEKTPTTFLTND